MRKLCFVLFGTSSLPSLLMFLPLHFFLLPSPVSKLDFPLIGGFQLMTKS